jgi:hypothetical protein
MRGAIRRPEFNGTYDVYVYDIEQAQALAHYFCENKVTDDVVLEAVVEAGILDYERSDTASPRQDRSPPTAASDDVRREKNNQRKAKQRAKERAEKEAGGVLRGPGRPPIVQAT